MPSPSSVDLTPAAPRTALRPLWTLTLSGQPCGLALAREKGWLLAWDEKHWLYLVDRKGARQAQTPARGALAAACCADDGSAYAAAGAGGEVWWLAPDLQPRWERSIHHRVVAAALDGFGNYLALADARGHLTVLDRTGRTVFRTETARPLHHLVFAAEAPFLVGCADFGLVGCWDFNGKCVWRDGLVAHCGSLAMSGDGARIVLACFSEGLRCYTLAGQNQGRLPVPEPCRLAALTFDGRYTLAATLADHLLLLDRDGHTLLRHPLDQPAVGLAIGPLGDHAAVALADGRVVALDLRGTVV